MGLLQSEEFDLSDGEVLPEKPKELIKKPKMPAIAGFGP
jgi:hypothetical protein